MYLNLFQLKELPFRLGPDARFLFLSTQHARAKATLEATLAARRGFVVISGELGTGKTTLIEGFLRALGPDVVVARLNQTQITPIGFLQGLLVQFGFSPFNMNAAEMAATIDGFLVAQGAAARKVVLVIDEAQTLPVGVLEEIPRLAPADGSGDRPLVIILAGQPELDDQLAAPALAALARQVRDHLHLEPLADEDTPAYIEHRLAVAGSAGRRIFTKAAIEIVRQFTGGVPRLINTLCDTAMMGSYALHKDTVDAGEVRAAIRELQWIEYAARTNRMVRTGLAPRATATELPPPLIGRLQVTSEGRAVTELELRPGRLLIGRTSENDLQIDSKYVSRHHCQLTVTPEGVTVEDLNSTNGLVVDGRRVRRYQLQHGDRVRIGLHTLTYAAEGPARSDAIAGSGSAAPHSGPPPR